MRESNEEEFSAFFENAEPRLSRLLLAPMDPSVVARLLQKPCRTRGSTGEFARGLDSQIAYLYRAAQS